MAKSAAFQDPFFAQKVAALVRCAREAQGQREAGGRRQQQGWVLR